VGVVTARPAVVVIGSVNVDLVLRVACLPAPGETVTGGSFARHGGGKGANAAVAAARSGAAVSIVAAVGDDELGRWQLAELSREGIDIAGVTRLEGVPTGVALIVVDESGENQIAVASGANAMLDAELVGRALRSLDPAPGAVCVLGFEVADAALDAAGRWASERAIRVIVDPAPARPISAALLAAHPILTPSASEAIALTGEGGVDRAAAVLRERSGAPVLVTLGSGGVLFLDDHGARTIPAPKVDVVDTTGAGDAFVGALAAALARGDELEEATRWAIAAASLSTMVAGARSTPSADAITGLLVEP
jgi:ribokinase